jgi:hypothetical protein
MRSRRHLVHAALVGAVIAVSAASACSRFSTTNASTTDTAEGGAPDANEDEADAGSEASAATSDGGPEGGWSCGRDTCDPRSQVCCWLDTKDAGALKCTSDPECVSDGGISFVCHTAADCVLHTGQGTHCCATVNELNGSRCSVAGCGQGEQELCIFDQTPDGCLVLDAGKSCYRTSGLQGFGYCN